MSVILAVLETSGSATTVLDTAARIAEPTRAVVEAVYVPRSAAFERRASLLASRADVPLRRLENPVHSSLIAAVAKPEVLIAVMSGRAVKRGQHPVGPLGRNLLEHTNKPVVVVRPDLALRPNLRRLLVPLEGTEISSAPVLDHLAALFPREVELVVLHVFTEATLPVMLDRPARDLEMVGREFLHRHLPRAHRIELRHGSVANHVIEASSTREIDLVVLSWSQDASPGRAPIIRDVLTSCPLPVLLLPTAPPTSALQKGSTSATVKTRRANS